MRSLLVVAGDSGRVGGPVARGRARRGGAGVTVTLVGAGPGDPALLTGAARDALRARATSSSTTGRRWTRSSRSRRRARSGTASAWRPGSARCRRPRSTRCWSSSARSRDAVVRLKSGDPFVASRGGEEAGALRAAGVARAGRPRRLGRAGRARRGRASRSCCASSASPLTVVDGNDDPEHGAPPDWEALARLGGTLVILTGRGRIRRIAAELIAGGLRARHADRRDQRRQPRRAAGPARHARRAARAAAAARDVRGRRRRRARPDRARVARRPSCTSLTAS